MGVDPKAILDMLDTADAKGVHLHGFTLVRHGHVVSQGWYNPYREDLRHMLFSLSKSFMSTAAGFAVQEGLLSLDAPVASFFPEKLPSPPCANMQAMKVRHLLGMCTGHTIEPNISEDFVGAFLTSYVPLEPGSRFLYNTAGSCVAGAIIEKVTGKHLDEYLKPRLFDPLGIEDYKWERLPGDICAGGFGLSLRTSDIAKFGQFLLQRGMWDGQRLLNAAWVDEATSFHILQPEGSPDWHSGYGYQFWRCSREDAYRGDGAFGQLCVVIPKHDMVIAVNAGLGDMQQELDVIFDALVSGLSGGPIPYDPKAQEALEARISALAIPSAVGSAAAEARRPASLPDAPSGKAEYVMSDNKLGMVGIGVSFGETDGLVIRYQNYDLPVTVGNQEWLETIYDKDSVPATLSQGDRSDRCSVAGTVSGGEWRVRIAYTTTPFIDDVSISFVGEAIRVSLTRNVGFEAMEYKLVGLRKQR
jgi:CubicO group peptidase (beta-lactamase class C family)